jgi:hypothetical protein
LALRGRQTSLPSRHSIQPNYSRNRSEPMKAVDRMEHACRREAYATKAVYGVVAASAALIMVVAVGPFYELALWGQLLGLAVVTVTSFGAGVVIGSIADRLHRNAHLVVTVARP